MPTIYPDHFIRASLATDKGPAVPHAHPFPNAEDLELRDTDGAGKAVIAKKSYKRGQIVGRFTGEVSPEIRQHTLQVDPANHLYDPHFIGYLMHSCNPNVVLDMQQRVAYCVLDIAKGEALTMDYATTEDVLFKQFACLCPSPNCRLWISGRAETVNAEGQLYLMKTPADNAETLPQTAIRAKH